MATCRVSIVSVPVSDPDRSLAFFRDMLGFVVIRDSPMGPNMRWVQLGAPDAPGAPATLTLVTWFDKMPPGSVQGLLFNTDDLDGMHARLVSGGVSPGDIKTAPWALLHVPGSGREWPRAPARSRVS